MTDNKELVARLQTYAEREDYAYLPYVVKEDCKRAADALERLEKLSGTNIMLAVVPGDGNGLEVYAKSVAEVEQKLSAMDGGLEDWQLGIKRLPVQSREKCCETPALCELNEQCVNQLVQPSQAVEFNNAINFALEQGMGCSDFLRAWREGDTSEWPEFSAINAKGPTPT